MYVITDCKAQKTTDPFSCPNDEVAKRNFLFGCFASDTPPQDCNLWRVADYSVDDSDCNIFSVSQNIHLVTCTVEEVEGYYKAYNSLHHDFEIFEDKGVIA